LRRHHHARATSEPRKREPGGVDGVSETGELFDLLPTLYRVRDADHGTALQALLHVLEREARVVDRDIEQLYENWFIETCDPWVVPYIGDLLGVRRLHPVGPGTGSLRAYVANTLSYRRRKAPSRCSSCSRTTSPAGGRRPSSSSNSSRRPSTRSTSACTTCGRPTSARWMRWTSLAARSSEPRTRPRGAGSQGGAAATTSRTSASTSGGSTATRSRASPPVALERRRRAASRSARSASTRRSSTGRVRKRHRSISRRSSTCRRRCGKGPCSTSSRRCDRRWP